MRNYEAHAFGQVSYFAHRDSAIAAAGDSPRGFVIDGRTGGVIWESEPWEGTE